MNVSELVDQLGILSTEGKALYKKYKALKEQEDSLRTDLYQTLQSSGLKSAKTNAYNAVISVKTDVLVQHEQSILNWLKTAPDVEADAYIGLKKTEFKTLAKQVLKETGEVIPGTELSTSEVLTIRENK